MLGTAVAAATIGIELCVGDLSLRAGLTILILAPELYGPLREVGRQFHASADATAAAERIFGAIDAVPEPPGATGTAVQAGRSGSRHGADPTATRRLHLSGLRGAGPRER